MATEGLTWQGQDIDTTTLNRQLTEMWSRINHEAATTGAMRTHVYNLVVYAADEAELHRTSASLRGLGKRHPSRAVLLRAERFAPRASVDAVIHVSCTDSVGGRPPLCHEQVLIEARGRAADHLASVVIPLLVPELRTYLWWPGQPLFGHRVFHRLLSVADQLVVDSAEFDSPGDGMANLVRLCDRKQGVSDFNWTRLRPWRDVITQFFDGPQWSPYAKSIRSVRLEFGSGGNSSLVTSGVLLLLGWMASRLGWAPETTLDNLASGDVTLAVIQGERVIPIDVRFADRGADAAGRLIAVEVVSQPRGEAPARFTVDRTDDLDHARVVTAVHDGPEITRVIPLELKTDVQLLADELELWGHDTLYDKAVDMAGRMAGREVWVPA